VATPADRWAEQAAYDLDTARAMLRSGRNLYVLFCCQQAVEKMLKARIVEKTLEFPPRLHHLQRLAQAAGLAMSSDQTDFLGELTAYYIQSRYPEEIEAIGEQVTPEIAAETLRKTEETLEWLKSTRP
jgi:HEPN domain-containing protein